MHIGFPQLPDKLEFVGMSAAQYLPPGGNVINLRIPFQCVKIIAEILVKMSIDKSKIASKSR